MMTKQNQTYSRILFLSLFDLTWLAGVYVNSRFNMAFVSFAHLSFMDYFMNFMLIRLDFWTFSRWQCVHFTTQNFVSIHFAQTFLSFIVLCATILI